MTMRELAAKSSMRGAATIELAVLFLPLFALTLGTTEMGRALYQYNAVAKTVRDAARYLATASIGSTLQARCLALTGSPSTSGSGCAVTTSLLSGLTLAQVSACDPSTCADHSLQQYGAGASAGVTNLVSVTITGYQFTSAIPFIAPSFTFGPVRATMPRPI
jgi:Flp pilus assembly protein TadG